jgi:hypothetical protein
MPTGGIALFVLAAGLFVLLIMANRKAQHEGSETEAAPQIADNSKEKE